MQRKEILNCFVMATPRSIYNDAFASRLAHHVTGFLVAIRQTLDDDSDDYVVVIKWLLRHAYDSNNWFGYSYWIA